VSKYELVLQRARARQSFAYFRAIVDAHRTFYWAGDLGLCVLGNRTLSAEFGHTTDCRSRSRINTCHPCAVEEDTIQIACP